MILNINGMNITIVEVDYDSQYLGMFRKDVQEIRLVKPYQRGILIHELTHAYLFAYGFSGAPFDEEHVANFVEIYAERILKDVKDYERSRTV